MKMFYSSELGLDEAPPTDHTHSPTSLLSSFYQFVIKRYHVKHIALLTLHDLLTALDKYHQEDMVRNS